MWLNLATFWQFFIDGLQESYSGTRMFNNLQALSNGHRWREHCPGCWIGELFVGIYIKMTTSLYPCTSGARHCTCAVFWRERPVASAGIRTVSYRYTDVRIHTSPTLQINDHRLGLGTDRLPRLLCKLVIAFSSHKCHLLNIYATTVESLGLSDKISLIIETVMATVFTKSFLWLCLSIYKKFFRWTDNMSDDFEQIIRHFAESMGNVWSPNGFWWTLLIHVHG